ncbi:MarR family winged helix-turn-helix transcriptional regulator [Hydrogenophaga sp.]|uniref:MarR family winged helix-turn-helix transcriptional regulator n=1 Tax=Hydrogenophaga sp. TaxID=1904254 RepID=UPI003D10A800
MPGKRKPATPSPLEAHLGFWLRFVSNHVSARFQKLLQDEGISVTEWVALRTLLGPEGTTHAALILALGMSKGAASKVISRLQDKGLAERWLADGRQREQVLVLTAAGQALVPRLAALADANDAHFFGHLTATEREGLMALMQELVQHHQLTETPTH